MQTEGDVLFFSPGKGEAEVACGSMKLRCKLADLLVIGSDRHKSKAAGNVRVVRKIAPSVPVLEINVLGLTVEQRKRIPGMDVRRADVIAGGAVLLYEAVCALGADEVRFSDGDNLEGYLLRRGMA